MSQESLEIYCSGKKPLSMIEILLTEPSNKKEFVLSKTMFNSWSTVLNSLMLEGNSKFYSEALNCILSICTVSLGVYYIRLFENTGIYWTDVTAPVYIDYFFLNTVLELTGLVDL
jgi:hypothetical protein